MQLVERHLIRKDDPRFAVIDAGGLCFQKPVQSGELSDQAVLHPRRKISAVCRNLSSLEAS